MIVGLAHSSSQLDVDNNGVAEPLTDGLLVIRHLFGFSGNFLIDGAVGTGASRKDAEQITGYLNEQALLFDVDGNNSVTALTDGLIIIRYLFGFSDDELVKGAISSDATRGRAVEIKAFLVALETGQPNDPALVDTDLDGLVNSIDLDDDNDGVLDVDDAFALINLGGLTDTDGDGRPNDCDTACLLLGMTGDPDDDNDGVLDIVDSYPLIALGNRVDSDGDGKPDICDSACLALGMEPELPALGIDKKSLVEINSVLNAKVVALSDFIEGSAKPTYYGLAPEVSNTTLKLNLAPASIDLSAIQAVFNGEIEGDKTAQLLFLLDRVPEAVDSGTVTVGFYLTNSAAVDAALTNVIGQRSNEDKKNLTRLLNAGDNFFETSFNLNWSFDGEVVAFEVPVQDQPVFFSQCASAYCFDASRSLKSVQPTLLNIRYPSEFVGYPLMLEIQLLNLFDEALVARLKEEGLYGFVQTYFDRGGEYYFSISLDGGSDAASFLSFGGASINAIEGKIKVADILIEPSTGFNLSVSDDATSEEGSGYLLKLEAAALADQIFQQGLFVNLCAVRLCFEQVPGGFLSQEFLNGIVEEATGTLTLVAQFDSRPSENDSLNYQITWTQGDDSVRGADEASITMSIPFDFLGNVVEPFAPKQEAATVVRVDNKGCSEDGVCSSEAISLTALPIKVGVTGVDGELEVGFDLLPSSMLATDYFDGFFEVGMVHLKVEITGEEDLLSYQQQVVSSIEGALRIQ